MVIMLARFTERSRHCFLTLFILGALAITASVEPALAVNGICGNANGSQLVTAPASNLCTVGLPSAVTGIGPWSWSCAGSGGGTDAACSAVQAGGVFYRSSDAGLNWTGKATGIGFNSPIYAIATSPAYASDHTVFLSAGSGTYKSTNNGDSWTLVQSGYSVQALAVSPAFSTDRTIFSGFQLAGIYKSTDGGASWSTANTGLPSTNIEELAISPAFNSDLTIFSGIYSNGVYKSSDRGATWIPANSGMVGLTALSLAVSPNYSSDRTVFAATTDGLYSGGGPHYHVYRSNDGGANWSLADSGLSGSISKLGISPTFASDQTIYAVTSSGIYKSTDSGNAWTSVNTATAGNSLVLSPVYGSDQTLFAGIYGNNIYASTTGGASWSPSNSNFATIRQLSAMGISPAFASDRNVFAAAYFAGPILSVSGSGAFGNIKTGTASANRQVTIANAMFGDANLAISSITLSGTDASQYSVSTGTCGSLTPTLVKGGQCSIDVKFTPTSAGSKNATLQINSNAVMSPTASISLSGTGITVTSTISSPASGFATSGTSVAVSGTASCSGGCTVSLVEVSADGGSTWLPAQGTTSWNASLPTAAAGAYHITSRATSSTGSVETPGNMITIFVDRQPPTGTLALYYGAWILNAGDGGIVCIMGYPFICGQLEMSFDGSSWQPATTAPGNGGPLWLRDMAGNVSAMISGTLSNSNGGPIRMAGSSSLFYSTLQHAFNSAQNGDTLKLTTAPCSENLIAATDAALTLRGGYDSSHGAVTGTTPLSGDLTVQAGSLTVENLDMTGSVSVAGGAVTANAISIQ